MPFSVVQHAQQVVAMTPLMHSLTFAEVLGNKDDKKKASCGTFNIGMGGPNTFKYPCDEFTIVLEGEIHLEDTTKPGELVVLKAGDIVHVIEGSTMKWSSPSKGKGFYVALKPFGDMSFLNDA